MNDAERPMTLTEKISIRCFLIVAALAAAMMTAIEGGIAFHLDIAKAFVNKGMWIGSIVWIVMALVAWLSEIFEKKEQKQDPLWARMIVATAMTALAICTQASIHWGVLTQISVWSNAVISVLILFIITCIAIPQTWKTQPVREVSSGNI